MDEEKRLKRAILRWVSDDGRIMTSIRTKMGKVSMGSQAYEHILIYFVKPMVGDGADAERAFLEVDYLKMFNGTQETMHASIDEFVNTVDRLPSGRRGSVWGYITRYSWNKLVFLEQDRFRHVSQGILQIGNTHAFKFIPR